MLKKVLVIDNDPQMLDVMQEILSYSGFWVDTFEGTDDILLLVKQYKPDLLIIDYILNGVNGGELCSKIKNCISTKNLPVIIFSAYSKTIQSLGLYHCNAYIEKPFSMQELLDKVTELIEIHPKTRINA